MWQFHVEHLLIIRWALLIAVQKAGVESRQDWPLVSGPLAPAQPTTPGVLCAGPLNSGYLPL
jgi:hypothetical protein